MPTQIKQTDDAASGLTTYSVDGEMLREDAELLACLIRSSCTQNGRAVVIDIADLDLMDSESAAILRRLERTDGIQIVGTEIFLQTIVDAAEKR